jgi:hypothetical protein
MTESPFDTPDAPGSGDRFAVADHVGSLVVIKVKGHEVGVETSAGTGDVIVADIDVVSGPDAGGHYSDAWVFGKVLVGQLKRKVGRTILGRFGQGEKQPGKTPAWVLNPATEAETAEALAYLNRASAPDTPAAQAAPPSDPWAAGPPSTWVPGQPAGASAGRDAPPF